MLNLKTAVTKIPEVYTQYPGYKPPADIWGGTWTAIFDTEGVFFRTPGGNASSFGAGQQTATFAAHTHYAFKYSATRYDGHLSGNNTAATFGTHKQDFGYQISPSGAGTADTGLTSSVGSSETRPLNRTVRLWRFVSF